MTKLEEYQENEEHNFHAENCLLLANLYGTTHDIEICEMNVWMRDYLGHAHTELSNDAYRRTNMHYKTLLACSPAKAERAGE